MNFCPQCGKKIHEPPPATSLGAQALVYCVSFFLPPLGLWYAYKYLKHGGGAEMKIGAAAIMLTVIAIGLTVWTGNILLTSINQSLQNFSSPL